MEEIIEKIKVKVDGEIIECKKGTTFYDLSKKYQKKYKYCIIAAKCDGVSCELRKEIFDPCEVTFCTMEDNTGRKAYIRGLTMIMQKAMYKEIGRDHVDAVFVEYTLDTGYYCEVKGDVVLDEALLKRVEARMRKYVERDFEFQKVSMNTLEAIKLFDRIKMYDKVKLINYRRSSRVNVYKLGSFVDYYYGPMPYSTGCLKWFQLQMYEGGFVFIIPNFLKSEEIPEFNPSYKLYQTMQESNHFGQMLNVDTVGALNDVIAKGRMRQLILVQEALHEKKIGDIAEEIKTVGTKRIVTIAGPSSSGKTTFSYRLSVQLETLGLIPHPIAVDDYFVNRDKTPKDKNGEYNYECLEAIDVEQLNKDLSALLRGEEVQLPTYNFITGMREYSKPKMKLGPEDVLVIEGIHGLNEKLTHSIPAENKYRIYISALTQLNIDEHNRIPTTDGRLLRRIIRDARTRGASARQTIAMWGSVRNGEDKNIFPFQEGADAMFNSALIYELAVLKQYAEPLLFAIPRGCEEYDEAKRLLKFLDYFLGISCEELPKNSILREFIGGSLLVN